MNRTVRIDGVEHTGLIVRNSERLAAWYTEVLGARIVSRSSDDPPILFLSFGHASLLELIPSSHVDERTTASDHVHLCLAVADDLETAVATLAALQVRLERPVFRAYDGSPVAFFRDPEGNLLQLVQRVSPLVTYT